MQCLRKIQVVAPIRRRGCSTVAEVEKTPATRLLADLAHEEVEEAASMVNWRIISKTVVPIAIVVNLYNSFVLREHPHGWRPEFKPYEHLRIRKRPNHFRDGSKSLFHHPFNNCTENGYPDLD